MAILWRLSPRQTNATLASQLAQRDTTAALSPLVNVEYFGLLAQIATSQGGQTSVAAATWTPAPDAVLITRQGSQRTSISAGYSVPSILGTRQGSQSTSGNAAVTSYQVITHAGGFLDAAKVSTKPGAGFWQCVPRQQVHSSLFSITAQMVLAAEAYFTPRAYNVYSDGIGTHSISFPVQTAYPTGISPGAFGTHHLKRRIVLTGIASGAVGTPIVDFSTISINLIGFFDEAFGAPRVARNPKPSGISSLVFGAHHIFTLTRTIYLSGFTTLGVGTPHVFNATQYIHPSGFTLLGFGVPYIAKPRYYAIPGISSMQFGLPMVSYRNRSLLVPGWNSARYGVLTIINADRAVWPDGFGAGRIGDHSIRLSRRFVYPLPFDSLHCGLPKIENRIGPMQRLRPSGIAPLGFGSHLVAPYYRYITFITTDIPYTGYGLPSVRHDKAYIQPEGWSSREMGRPRVVRHLAPRLALAVGFDSLHMGLPTVGFGYGVRPIEGFDSLQMGEVEAKLMRQYISFGPDDAKDVSRYGEPLVFNKNRFLYVNSQVFEYAPYISPYHKVENKKRYIRPQSWSSLRMTIYHNLVLPDQSVTLPYTYKDPARYGRAMVAFRIRHVYPDGAYMPYFSIWHAVYNAAFRVQPTGIDSLQKPRAARVWFNAQHIRPPHLVRPDQFGRPFVAFAVRYLYQYFPYAGTGMMPPTVGHTPRYIKVKPYELYPWVSPPRVHIPPSQYIRVTSIGHYPLYYGRPKVRNVTPELHPAGIITELGGPGKPWVSHAPRTITLTGILSSAFGVTDVTLANRTVFAHNIMQLVVPEPTVWQETDEVEHTKYIRPEGFETGNLLTIGSPDVRHHPSIEGWDSFVCGAHSFTTQGCKAWSPYADSWDKFGFPTLNADQWIYVYEGHDMGNHDYLRMGLPPDCSPRTIWAQTDPPAQAVACHPDSDIFYPVDLFTNSRVHPSVPPWFGTARVFTPGLQIIKERHPRNDEAIDDTDGGWVGDDTRIENRKRYIFTKGANSSRYGYPIINDPRAIWPQPFKPTQFGAHKVDTDKVWIQYIRPGGLYSTVFGPTRIELFNREVHPVGFDATIYGNNDPMVYHYPRGPKSVGGWDSLEFDEETWVSHSPRDCPIEGFDSFEEGYTVGQFKDRMRVHGTPGTAMYTAGDSLRMGVPLVTYEREPQRVNPYMIPPPQYCHPHSITTSP